MIGEHVRKYLKDFESQHDVRILMAREAGSRAWGFPLKDHDWDIRFIFVRNNRDDYFSLWPRKELIECRKMVNDFNLHFLGFDISKACRLAATSSPVIADWLEPKFQYIQEHREIDHLRILLGFYSSKKLFDHYLNCYRINVLPSSVSNFSITDKEILHSWKGLLSAMWLFNRKNSIPPTDLGSLLNGSPFLKPSTIKAINLLMAYRVDGIEDVVPDEIEIHRTDLNEIYKILVSIMPLIPSYAEEREDVQNVFVSILKNTTEEFK